MPIYIFDVIEIREQRCTYRVEADSFDEARAKAEIGDTVSEEDDGIEQVRDRQVQQFMDVEEEYVDWCDTNDCERSSCHRCFPRQDCEDHEKCKEFTESGEAYTDEQAENGGA